MVSIKVMIVLIASAVLAAAALDNTTDVVDGPVHVPASQLLSVAVRGSSRIGT